MLWQELNKWAICLLSFRLVCIFFDQGFFKLDLPKSPLTCRHIFEVVMLFLDTVVKYLMDQKLPAYAGWELIIIVDDSNDKREPYWKDLLSLIDM
jgi:hypothetical protein